MDFREEQYVSGQGNSLAVYRAGNSGPAIFVVGGLTRVALPETDLGRVMAAAVDLGTRVTMMDLAGTGHSQLAGKATMDGMLKDVADVYRRYVNEPAVWIGASMGGWLMLILHRDNPSWFRGMSALAPAIDWDVNHLLPGRDAGLIKETAGGDLQLAASVVPRELLDSMAAFRLGAAPYTLEAPLHIIHGARDDVVPVTSAIAFAARLGRRCTVEVLGGDGHEVGKLKSEESLVAFARWLKGTINDASRTAAQG